MIQLMRDRGAGHEKQVAALGVDAQADLRAEPETPAVDGPVLRLAIAFMAGIVGAHSINGGWGWLALAAAALGLMGWGLRRQKRGWSWAWGLAATAALGGTWYELRVDHAPADDIARLIADEPVLAEVRGRVAGPAKRTSTAVGPFGEFDYRSPGTVFELDVASVTEGDEQRPASGRLLVKLEQVEHRLTPGATIAAVGWLSGIDGPRNPGEFDYRQKLASRGVHARLTVKSRGAWTLLAPAPIWGDPLGAVRRWASSSALASLELGMANDPRGLALLETMLLGVWRGDSRGTVEAFRRVGLAHLLSISGAHLAILLGMVWLLARLWMDRPPRAAMVVLVVLGLYLLAVPLRAPVVRAAVMAGLFAAAYASGRRIRPLELMGLAAIVILLWRPNDLFSAGFQLSFGVVTGLLLFTRRVSHWLWPESPLAIATAGSTAVRWVVDYLAVSLVAFLIAAPCVAYHYQLVSPWAVLLSVLAWPVVGAVLAVGYFKILIGLVLPSVSLMLGGLAGWLADTMLGLVDRAGGWPGSSVELAASPGVGWTLGATAAAAALLGGLFAGRRRALVGCLALLAAWGWWDIHGVERTTPAPGGLVVNMLAVGDGSCFVVRFDDGRVLMFDCGSQAYLDIGSRSVLPALRRLGIDRIDVLVLSHADLDHFSGVLDVMEGVGVERVWAPPQLMAEAEAAIRDRRWTSTRLLVESLQAEGLVIEEVTRGHRERWGSAELEVLWPADGELMKWANDTSVVLSIRAAGRRVLLNGDIQQEGITRLLALDDDLEADVTDLPHHGSFVEASPAWLDAVRPRVALQSSGKGRLRRDAWDAICLSLSVTRLITARSGMAEVRIDAGGGLSWSAFAQKQESRKTGKAGN